MTLLEKLQQHYQDQCASHQRLGDLPKIEDSEWILQPQESQALLNWILSQKWQYEQVKLYDGFYGLESSALELLSTMVKKGLGMHPTVKVDPENKVFLAVAFVVRFESTHEYFSYVLDGVKHGDPLMLAMAFTQWIGNYSLAEVVLERISNVSEKDFWSFPFV